MYNHIVPRFIVKRFLTDKSVLHNFADNSIKSVRKPDRIFGVKDYYPDELEKKWAHSFETKVAELYQKIEKNLYSAKITIEDLLNLSNLALVIWRRNDYQYLGDGSNFSQYESNISDHIERKHKFLEDFNEFGETNMRIPMLYDLRIVKSDKNFVLTDKFAMGQTIDTFN